MSETSKHTKIMEAYYELDSGEPSDEYVAEKGEPMVFIKDEESHVILPIRLLREFLCAYDGAQKEDK